MDEGEKCVCVCGGKMVEKEAKWRAEHDDKQVVTKNRGAEKSE